MDFKSLLKNKYLGFVILAVVVVSLIVLLVKREHFTGIDSFISGYGSFGTSTTDEIAPVFPQSLEDGTPDGVPADQADLAMQSQQMNPADLLPSGDGMELLGKNYLTSAYQIGVDSRGSSLKVPNLQLRSDPVVPKIPNITPWNESSATQDTMRTPFEIGCQ